MKLAAVLVLIVYLQLVVGAVMRHYRAGLAIPDLPLAYGNLLPPVSARGLEAVNEFRTWDARLERVTLGQIWLHFTHRLGAIAVTVAVAALVLRIVRRRQRELFGAAALLSALIVAQLTLGVLTVLWRKPADVASLHVATGALVLVTAFVIAVRARRLDWLSAREAVRTAVHVEARSAPLRINSGEEVQGGGELAPA